MPKKSDRRRKYFPTEPRPAKDKVKTGHDPIKPVEKKQHRTPRISQILAELVKENS